MTVQIGNAPWADNRNRRINRRQKNVSDKSTVVSIFPQEIDTTKPTIFPGRFIIPAGSFEKPSVLVVEQSSWFHEFHEDVVQEMTSSSMEVADAIINDYCNGLLEVNGNDCMPGLFYEPGAHTSAEIKSKFAVKLEAAKIKQLAWFERIVKQADVMWARTNGNPLAIWDMAKIAANQLNLNNKPWLKDQQVSELVRCIACGSLRNPAYPVCSTCKAIDPNYKGEIKFAK